jgi:hypothetical protein
MTAKLPVYEPPPSFEQINQQNEENLARNMKLLSGGSRRKRQKVRFNRRRQSYRHRRRMFGGEPIEEVPRLGNAQADNNAVKIAEAMNQMNQLMEKKGGGKKRRFKTSKYLKVNYVRKQK